MVEFCSVGASGKRIVGTFVLVLPLLTLDDRIALEIDTNAVVA
jgi:hypothetical protein